MFTPTDLTRNVRNDVDKIVLASGLQMYSSIAIHRSHFTIDLIEKCSNDVSQMDSLHCVFY
jgi:hypothetical protein